MQSDRVVTLRPAERIRQDAAPVATIYRDMGPVSAEKVVSRALGELALTMAGLSSRIRRHELSDVSRLLRRLQRMADNLGMVSLGAAAGDLRACLACNDPTAFAAVWARLLRIAELSLAPDKDLLDQSLL